MTPEHNYEHGREHDGYKHVGIPPGCPACAAERRDQAFLIADEDVDFADEWDDADSAAYHARVEAGLEPED